LECDCFCFLSGVCGGEDDDESVILLNAIAVGRVEYE
jgi:hypothetical protein